MSKPGRAAPHGASVVVGVDGSADSVAAVDFAITEAALRGVPLRAVNNAGPALAVASRTASLVVVGQRGADGYSGGVVGYLAAHAACPVLVVRSPAVADAAPHVSVGVDGTDGSVAALRFGVEYARRRGWPVHAICALPYVNSDDNGRGVAAEQRRRVELWLTDWMSPVAADHRTVDIRLSVQIGQDPARALLRAGESASLMVVGSRRRAKPTSLMLGSVGYVLVHHGDAPVAVVPKRSAPEPPALLVVAQ